MTPTERLNLFLDVAAMVRRIAEHGGPLVGLELDREVGHRYVVHYHANLQSLVVDDRWFDADGRWIISYDAFSTRRIMRSGAIDKQLHGLHRHVLHRRPPLVGGAE